MAEFPRLQAMDLAVKRGGRQILAGISFSFSGGQVVALLGPNGAGKSTLLKVLAGLLPFSGTLHLDGRDASRIDRLDRARQVAYVPQHSALEAALPVRQVVSQGRYAHRDQWGRPHRHDQDAIDRAMVLTDTHRLADRAFCRLSYGERRLVLVARALATEAHVLLMDEPTAALDVTHALSLADLLRRLAECGRLILVALHQLNEAAQMSDQAMLLDGGRLVTSGPVHEVIADEPLRRVYGVHLVPAAQFGFRLANDADGVP